MVLFIHWAPTVVCHDEGGDSLFSLATTSCNISIRLFPWELLESEPGRDLEQTCSGFQHTLNLCLLSWLQSLTSSLVRWFERGTHTTVRLSIYPGRGMLPAAVNCLFLSVICLLNSFPSHFYLPLCLFSFTFSPLFLHPEASIETFFYSFLCELN